MCDVVSAVVGIGSALLSKAVAPSPPSPPPPPPPPPTPQEARSALGDMRRTGAGGGIPQGASGGVLTSSSGLSKQRKTLLGSDEEKGSLLG